MSLVLQTISTKQQALSDVFADRNYRSHVDSYKFQPVRVRKAKLDAGGHSTGGDIVVSSGTKTVSANCYDITDLRTYCENNACSQECEHAYKRRCHVLGGHLRVFYTPRHRQLCDRFGSAWNGGCVSIGMF